MAAVDHCFPAQWALHQHPCANAALPGLPHPQLPQNPSLQLTPPRLLVNWKASGFGKWGPCLAASGDWVTKFSSGKGEKASVRGGWPHGDSSQEGAGREQWWGVSLCVGTGLAPGSGGWRWERSRRTLPLLSPSGLAWVGFTPSQVPSQGNQSTRQESVRVRSPCPLSDGWCGLRGQRKWGRVVIGLCSEGQRPWGWWLDFSKPLFPHLQDRDNNTYFYVHSWAMCVSSFITCVVLRKHSHSPDTELFRHHKLPWAAPLKPPPPTCIPCSVAESSPTFCHPMDCSPGVCSDSSPLSRWYCLTISSSVIPFSFCLQSFPASGSLPMNWLLTPGGQCWSFSFSTEPPGKPPAPLTPGSHESP